VITNGPQTGPGDVSPSWSPQRNVAESQQYDRLLKESPAFRQTRMRKECGPLPIRSFIGSASTALLNTNPLRRWGSAVNRRRYRKVKAMIGIYLSARTQPLAN
jgi:hypothetical protein